MSSMLLHLAMSAVMATGAPGVPIAYHVVPDTTRAAVRAAIGRAYVEVDNRHFNDANVFVIQGLRSVRLGTVGGLTSHRFVIPNDMVGGALPVRFAVRRLATRRATLSDEISVSQGDTVGLLVPPF